MKFIVSILLIALLSFAFGLYMPWWSLALAAFVVAALIHQRSGRAFLSGFLGLFLLWGIMAFIIDQQNQHLLSVKVAQLLPLGGSSMLLILVTALIGGLVAGLAAMAGSYLRTIRRNQHIEYRTRSIE
jgi:hypothetical protein